MKTTTLDQLLKDLKLTVKGVKYHEGHDAGIGLNCKVLINRKVIAHAHDDARGGEMEVNPENYSSSNREALRELGDKLYDRNTHKYTYQYEDGFMGKKQMFSVRLETLINKAVEIFEIKKEEKSGIVLDDGTIIKFAKVTIPTLFKKYPRETVIKALQKNYDSIIKEGKVVENKEYLSSVGVNV